MGRYFDQSELYVGKYLNDSIFTHALAPIQRRPSCRLL